MCVCVRFERCYVDVIFTFICASVATRPVDDAANFSTIICDGFDARASHPTSKYKVSSAHVRGKVLQTKKKKTSHAERVAGATGEGGAICARNALFINYKERERELYSRPVPLYFTALSLFNSYVIALMSARARTALEYS